MPRDSDLTPDLTRDPTASRLRAPPMDEAATKPCERCSTQNPGAANFCFHCGWPFGREALPAAPPVAEPPDPFADWSESTERVQIDNERAREDIRARLEELAQEAADS